METTRIGLNDPRYPPLLKETADPPAFLYIRGDAGLLSRTDCLAVVGTRKCTRYGLEATALLAGDLAAGGAPIVSGLALGIDAAAHEAALAAGGKTIAVLAAGVEDDDIGPRTNYGLAQRILRSGGAIVSEKPTGTPAYKLAFLERNRIVSGMCRATIIVEAAETSGALVTARLALEANRDVFSVPGPITSPASIGTNHIIAEGAIPALSSAFVLDMLGVRISRGGAEPALSNQERAVLDAFRAGATNPDDIVENTGLSVRDISAALTSLAIKGAIKAG